MAKISQNGLNFIKSWEGQRLSEYDDGTGIPTIGVGHTGPGVYEGERITVEQEDALLRGDVAGVESTINAHTKVNLTQNQFDALVSLGFNIGSCGLLQSSVFRYTNEGNFKQAAKSFVLWNRAGGEVLAGLTNRREAEAHLYLTGLYK
jgi:lysozyme